MNELRYIAVQMVSRDLMTNKSISADFKGAVHDRNRPDCSFQGNYLLSCITTFDARFSKTQKTSTTGTAIKDRGHAFDSG